MGYGVMVTLHGVMGYGVMVLHNAQNCNKVMTPCDHGTLANGAMQYNHGALRLGAVQKGEIFIDPVHFIFKFHKRINFIHFDLLLRKIVTDAAWPRALPLNR
jgi:hypothetical protein